MSNTNVIKLTSLFNFPDTIAPKGWLVREKINAEGKAVSFEYGAYISGTDVFLSIPIHYNLKSELIAIDAKDTTGETYKYYAVPDTLKLALSTYTNKKGKVCNMLVKANKGAPVIISCLAIDCIPSSKIIGAEIISKAKVIRKYIDKERHCMGLIMVEKEIPNVNTVVKVEFGTMVGVSKIKTETYTFSNPPHTETEEHTVEGPIETKFIKLPMFNVNPVNNASHDNKHANKKAE